MREKVLGHVTMLLPYVRDLIVIFGGSTERMIEELCL